MAKKFAKKIATYAMAATMIGGAVINLWRKPTRLRVG